MLKSLILIAACGILLTVAQQKGDEPDARLHRMTRQMPMGMGQMAGESMLAAGEMMMDAAGEVIQAGGAMMQMPLRLGQNMANGAMGMMGAGRRRRDNEETTTANPSK